MLQERKQMIISQQNKYQNALLQQHPREITKYTQIAVLTPSKYLVRSEYKVLKANK